MISQIKLWKATIWEPNYLPYLACGPLRFNIGDWGEYARACFTIFIFCELWSIPLVKDCVTYLTGGCSSYLLAHVNNCLDNSILKLSYSKSNEPFEYLVFVPQVSQPLAWFHHASFELISLEQLRWLWIRRLLLWNRQSIHNDRQRWGVRVNDLPNVSRRSVGLLIQTNFLDLF